MSDEAKQSGGDTSAKPKADNPDGDAKPKAKAEAPVDVAVIVDRPFNEHRRGDKLLIDPKTAKLWLSKKLVRPDKAS